MNENSKMICQERLSEIVKIEKERILEEFKTKDSVLCDSYVSWGVIHSARWIYKDEDVDRTLSIITKEQGFVCFKSTPHFIDIIKAAVLVHFGVKDYSIVIS